MITKKIPGDPVLSDAIIMKLALCVEEKEVYLKLAESALKMQEYEIYSCLEKNKDLIMATQNLLHKWRNSQTDGKVAFKNISEALKGSEDMEELIDILETDGKGNLMSFPPLSRCKRTLNWLCDVFLNKISKL